jgi:hypothetical protein
LSSGFEGLRHRVAFSVNGTRHFVRETEDLKGQVVQRDLCEMNAAGDVRKCFEWDSGVTRRDMKDRSGVWQIVAEEPAKAAP